MQKKLSLFPYFLIFASRSPPIIKNRSPPIHKNSLGSVFMSEVRTLFLALILKNLLHTAQNWSYKRAPFQLHINAP